jgi:hypothetical protein
MVAGFYVLAAGNHQPALITQAKSGAINPSPSL